MKLRVALLGGVTALGAVLLYAHHGGASSEAKPSTERKADGVPAAARSVAPTETPHLGGEAPVVKTDDVEHANVEGLPEPLEPGWLAVEHAAKGCYRGHRAPAPIRPNGPDETVETIQLAYRQVSSHGVGRVEDLKVAHGALTDQALQSCIVNAVAAVTWSSTAPDGAIGNLEQEVNLGDLRRPDRGLPPESQRSPKPTAPPPAALAGPLGKQTADAEDEHPDVIVPDPGPAKQPK